jgi:hypothetical protein
MAPSASSAEQLIEDLFGEAALCSELASRTYIWTIEQHAARVWWPDDLGPVATPGPEPKVDTVHDKDDPLCIASDFHREAVRLLRERSVRTLSDLGPIAARTLARRIKP